MSEYIQCSKVSFRKKKKDKANSKSIARLQTGLLLLSPKKYLHNSLQEDLAEVLGYVQFFQFPEQAWRMHTIYFSAL